MPDSREQRLKIEHTSVAAMRPYSANARTHSRKQVKQIAASIEKFGFNNPVLVDAAGEIIAGHGRVAAAKLLGLTQVPTIMLPHLSDKEKRAYVLADNKIALNAGWDLDSLAVELKALGDLNFDIELTGFTIAEADGLIIDSQEADSNSADDEDRVPEVASMAITKPGDLWFVGRHRLICGDATDGQTYHALLKGEQVGLIFADPPYNLPVCAYVEGTGRRGHRAFASANGELTAEQYRAFLQTCFDNAADHARPGAIAYACIDWRHMEEMRAAGAASFSELKNLIVWNKTNAGMGNFYRSKHELIFAFKAKPGSHINNFNLGESGRHRTNVWDYAGVASFGGNSNRRLEDLASHPTVKPVALVADAIRDTSKRGDVVLDMFGGAGTTLVAAEKTGRSARLIEIDPNYVDVILRRYRQYVGREPVHAVSGLILSEVEAAKVGEQYG